MGAPVTDELNLSKKEALIIHAIMTRPAPQRYGHHLIRTAGSDIKQGTVYVLLGRLEKKGMLTSSTKEDAVSGVCRRFYEVTPKGLRAMRQLSRLGI